MFISDDSCNKRHTDDYVHNQMRPHMSTRCSIMSFAPYPVVAAASIWSSDLIALISLSSPFFSANSILFTVYATSKVINTSFFEEIIRYSSGDG